MDAGTSTRTGASILTTSDTLAWPTQPVLSMHVHRNLVVPVAYVLLRLPVNQALFVSVMLDIFNSLTITVIYTRARKVRAAGQEPRDAPAHGDADLLCPALSPRPLALFSHPLALFSRSRPLALFLRPLALARSPSAPAPSSLRRSTSAMA